jgi:hypothetical protein
LPLPYLVASDEQAFLQPLTVGEAAAVLKPLSAPYELTTAGACADPQVFRLASFLETKGRMLGLYLTGLMTV